MLNTDLSRIALIAMLSLAPAMSFAQETTATTDAETTEAAQTETPAADAETADPLGFNTGVSAENRAGTTYTREEFTDWQLRCVRTQDGAEGPNDPCQLYQLLKDSNGNSVAEVSLLALPKSQGGAVAGATIITPLETLLTQQITMRIDNAAEKKYPFTWCSTVGCYSRIGFTNAEIQAFRAGNAVKVSIVPIAAADQRVDLTMSLSGFTAGFKAVKDANEAIEQN